MKFRRKQRENVDINLASLIDVVFILLLFLVVTTTFTRQTELRVDLPEAVSGSPAEDQQVKQLEIAISADGKTQHQAVVTAMDAAGKLGFSHLRMSTVEAASQP